MSTPLLIKECVLTLGLMLFVSALCCANTPVTIKSDIIKTPLLSHWYDKITLGGLIQVGSYFSNTTPTTVGTLPKTIGPSPASSDISVPLAMITSKTTVSDCSKVIIDLAYAQKSPSFVRSPAGGGETLFIDKAYIGFENPKSTPWYVQAGRNFVDFGGLDNSSVTNSTVQLLSLIRATQIAVGFKNIHGFNASTYLFRSPMLRDYDYLNSSQSNAFGADLSFSQKNESIEFLLDAGFISHIDGALYTFSTSANQSRFKRDLAYTDAVSGLELNGTLKLGLFDFKANYIAALKEFSVFDIPFTVDGGSTFKGAKPSAYGLNAGLSFHIKHHLTRLSAGYQGSKEAAALGTAAGSIPYNTPGVYGNNFAIGIPKSRIFANYMIKDIQSVNLEFEIDADKGYSFKNGGTGKDSLTGIVLLTALLS